MCVNRRYINSTEVHPRLYDHVVLRPQKRGCLSGGGGGGGERWRKNEGSTADTARKRPWTAARTMEVLKAVSPRHCAATSALGSCSFYCRARQSQKDSFCCTAAEEQSEAKEVQLSQPSSTSLLMISSGLTWGSSSTSLLLISPGTDYIPLVEFMYQCLHACQVRVTAGDYGNTNTNRTTNVVFVSVFRARINRPLCPQCEICTSALSLVLFQICKQARFRRWYIFGCPKVILTRTS